MSDPVYAMDVKTKVRPIGSRRCAWTITICATTVLIFSIVGMVAYLSVRQSAMEKELNSLWMDIKSTENRARRNAEPASIPIRPRQKKNTRSAHFESFSANESEALGERTAYGFRPKDQIYRIWKPSNWTDERKYRYDPSTGKVTVKRGGMYLVYGQVLFHGPAARQSFGIHVNDEKMSVVESVQYDTMPWAGMVNVSTARYHQCNTMAVLYIDAGSQVFLKSPERGRSIIPGGHITFWGLAKL